MSTDTRRGFAAVVTNNPAWVGFVALVGAVLLPLALGGSYRVNVLVLVAVFCLLALSLDLLLGFTGYLSLAHHGLWAVGAYTSALLSVRLGLSAWLGMLGAVVATAAFGAAIAVPAFRVRGHYFALVTLAIGELVRIVITNWVALTDGPFGLTGIPAPALPGVGTIDSRLGYYYLTLGFVVIVVLGMVRLLRSPYGRCLRAIREDEDLAEAQGLRLLPYKVSAYALSGAIAGLSGALFAHYQHVIGPDNFTIQYMAETLVMVVVGGSGLIAGSIVGPLIFVPLPEVLRGLGSLSGSGGVFGVLADSRLVVFGLLLIAIVVWTPEGIAGRAKSVLARAARDPEGETTVADGEKTTDGGER